METKKAISLTCGVGLLVLVSFWIGLGVGSDRGQEKGFRLPPGDAEAGLAAFVELNCSHCHTVAGEKEFERPAEYEELLVPLGGNVRVVKTYGELVTAIIHPKESVRPDVNAMYIDANGQSIMPDLTSTMKTRELIDLVTYLQEHYEVVIPQHPTNYYPYGVGGGGIMP
jgi:mono/diheme cytochrome c family protein